MKQKVLCLLAQWWLPMPLAVLNWWLFEALVLRGENHLLLIAQTYSGVLLVALLAHAANAAKSPAPCTQSAALRPVHGWVAWFKALVWTGAWGLAWLFLPVDGLLRLFALASFFRMTWLAATDGAPPIRVPTEVFRVAMPVCLLVGLAFTVMAIVQRSFVRQRLASDFFGPLDLEGRHHAYAKVLQTMHSLQFFGPSSSGLPESLAQSTHLELLALATHVGAVPAVIAALGILGMWLLAHRWLANTSCGPALGADARRLGLVLIVMQGLTSLINVLWNFGFLRQEFASGLPPFMLHPSWWLLSLATLSILKSAYRERQPGSNID